MSTPRDTTLQPGARLGPYAIVGAIGAGGMGEVYRARDAKLNRDVALKVLPEALAADSDRLARFQREAQVLAALNHPNIAHIHGFEDADGIHAIVMELVEGPTLADRIASGALPLSDALPIARQIAEALEAAHEQGIVHRDLKPANIKVRDDGTVKVLDFGLAKAFDPVAEQSADLMNSPTLTARATQLGMILGTAAYMAPEQAKGKPVDRRADVWAFGVVLYEMLTGTRAFAGSDVSETLASVLAREPDWSALPSSTPAPIVKLLRQCLEKDRKERTPDIAVARFAIRDAQAGAGASAPDAQAAMPLWRQPALWAVAATVALAAGGLGWWLARPVPEPARISRSAFLLPAAPGNPTSRIVAVSPLGTAVAFIAKSQVWLRRLDDLEPMLLTPNEDDARRPVFSPDGQHIAFGTGQRIKRVATSGGSPVDVGGPVPRRFPGLHWADDGFIYVGTDNGIARIPSTGGQLETVIANGAEGTASGPFRLPDSEWLLFTLATNTDWDKAKVVAESLTTHERRVLVDGGYDARVLPGEGLLVYFAGGTLFGRPFDRSRVATTGGPVSLVANVAPAAGRATSDTNYDVSRRGDLVYVFRADESAGSQLAFVDRKGQQTPLPIELATMFRTLRLSPDGKRVAVALGESNVSSDIWLHDVDRAGRQRLTTDGRSFSPVWSPDGAWVYYASQNPDGPGASVWRRRADLSGQAEQVFSQAGASLQPYSMSADGKRMGLQILRTDAATYMAAVLDLDGASAPRFLMEPGKWESREPSLSPDGRFVAYASSETGGAQVYVQEVSSGRKRVISDRAAIHPRWTHDGKEILFVDQGGPGYSVVRVLSADRLEFSAPTPLVTRPTGPPTNYDVSRDATRLLYSLAKGAGAPGEAGPQVRLVLNWIDEVRAKLPVK